jgi:serine/threonine-protein kinase
VIDEGPRSRLPFDRLGDYDVIAPIAEGGMASVWLGRRHGTQTEFVAIKVIRPEHARNKEFLAMFADEAGIARRLAHPNILAVRSLGGLAREDGEEPFLVMELLRGHTLLDTWKTLHAKGKRLPPAVTAWIGARVADALHYAHELADEAGAPLHVVHRDVNPANVFLTSEGEPKLIDFGLAKARDRIASTAIGIVKGKLAYLAPEQAHGKPADRRSDVFALGVTLWELSLDRRLFLDESDVQTVRKVREADVPDPRTLEKDYPAGLAEAVLRALAKEPEQRWQTAAELRDALDAFVQGSGHAIGAHSLRAILHETFAGATAAEWETAIDEAVSENAKTHVWDERKGAGEEPAVTSEAAERKATSREDAAPSPEPALPTPVRTEPLPVVARASAPAPRTRRPGSGVPLELLGVVAAVAVGGSLIGGLVARGCSGRSSRPGVEQRVAHLEDLLGVGDAGSIAPGAPSGSASGVIVSADDPVSACAVAKVTSYRAWQEALAKAKVNAQPAEAACADIWSDTRKQACYRAAMGQIHATQAARDAVIAGGSAAREAVKAARDDAKNEAIARARTASQAAFDACSDDGG